MREQPNHLIARTIIDRGVLEEVRSDLADIHLHPVARHGSRVAFPAPLADEVRTLEAVEAMPAENLVDGVDAQPQVVESVQFVPEALNAKLPFSSQRDDALLLDLVHLASRRPKGPTAPIDQAVDTPSVVPTPPFPRHRTRYAALRQVNPACLVRSYVRTQTKRAAGVITPSFGCKKAMILLPIAGGVLGKRCLRTFTHNVTLTIEWVASISCRLD